MVDEEVASTASASAASAIRSNSPGLAPASSGPDSWTKLAPSTAASTVSDSSTVPIWEAT